MDHELSRMTEEVAVLMRDRRFGDTDLASIMAFLQDFKAPCNTCAILEGAALWLFKYSVGGAVQSIIIARVALPTDTMKAPEGCYTNVSAVVHFLLIRYATENTIAAVNDKVRNFLQLSFSATKYAQQLWPRALMRGSVYKEKVLEDLLVEGVKRAVSCFLRQRWSDDPGALLEDLE